MTGDRAADLAARVAEARRPKLLRASTRLLQPEPRAGRTPVPMSPAGPAPASVPMLDDAGVSAEAAGWLTGGVVPDGLVPLVGDPEFPSRADTAPPAPEPAPTAPSPLAARAPRPPLEARVGVRGIVIENPPSLEPARTEVLAPGSETPPPARSAAPVPADPGPSAPSSAPATPAAPLLRPDPSSLTRAPAQTSESQPPREPSTPHAVSEGAPAPQPDVTRASAEHVVAASSAPARAARALAERTDTPDDQGGSNGAPGREAAASVAEAAITSASHVRADAHPGEPSASSEPGAGSAALVARVADELHAALGASAADSATSGPPSARTEVARAARAVLATRRPAAKPRSRIDPLQAAAAVARAAQAPPAELAAPARAEAAPHEARPAEVARAGVAHAEDEARSVSESDPVRDTPVRERAEAPMRTAAASESTSVHTVGELQTTTASEPTRERAETPMPTINASAPQTEETATPAASDPTQERAEAVLRTVAASESTRAPTEVEPRTTTASGPTLAPAETVMRTATASEPVRVHTDGETRTAAGAQGADVGAVTRTAAAPEPSGVHTEGEAGTTAASGPNLARAETVMRTATASESARVHTEGEMRTSAGADPTRERTEAVLRTTTASEPAGVPTEAETRTPAGAQEAGVGAGVVRRTAAAPERSEAIQDAPVLGDRERAGRARVAEPEAPLAAHGSGSAVARLQSEAASVAGTAAARVASRVRRRSPSLASVFDRASEAVAARSVLPKGAALTDGRTPPDDHASLDGDQRAVVARVASPELDAPVAEDEVLEPHLTEDAPPPVDDEPEAPVAPVLARATGSGAGAMDAPAEEAIVPGPSAARVERTEAAPAGDVAASLIAAGGTRAASAAEQRAATTSYAPSVVADDLEDQRSPSSGSDALAPPAPSIDVVAPTSLARAVSDHPTMPGSATEGPASVVTDEEPAAPERTAVIERMARPAPEADAEPGPGTTTRPAAGTEPVRGGRSDAGPESEITAPTMDEPAGSGAIMSRALDPDAEPIDAGPAGDRPSLPVLQAGSQPLGVGPAGDSLPLPARDAGSPAIGAGPAGDSLSLPALNAGSQSLGAGAARDRITEPVLDVSAAPIGDGPTDGRGSSPAVEAGVEPTTVAADGGAGSAAVLGRVAVPNGAVPSVAEATAATELTAEPGESDWPSAADEEPARVVGAPRIAARAANGSQAPVADSASSIGAAVAGAARGLRLARVPAARRDAVLEARVAREVDEAPAVAVGAPQVLPGESLAETLQRLAGATATPTSGQGTSVELARTADADQPQVQPQTPAPTERSKTATTPQKQPDLDELYDQLADRLRRELLDERERRGDLLDPPGIR